MAMNDILKGKKKQRKRLGRGPGSGTGKTAGKGHKGQRARSGSSMPVLFEGGQMPLYRRIPKRGFSNAPFKTVYTPVNLCMLGCFKDGDTVSLETLKEKGLVKGKKAKVKILGKGDVEARLKVDVSAVSKTAREKIIAKGGEVVESKGA